MDQHSHFVESRNQLYLQLRSSLADNVDFSKPQEKINTLNTKWKIVQGGVETNCRNLEECYKLLKSFEENARKMRSWTLESDLSQVRHTYSSFISCNWSYSSPYNHSGFSLCLFPFNRLCWIGISVDESVGRSFGNVVVLCIFFFL